MIFKRPLVASAISAGDGRGARVNVFPTDAGPLQARRGRRRDVDGGDVGGAVRQRRRRRSGDGLAERQPGDGRRRRPPFGQRLGVGDEGRPRTVVVQVPQVLRVAGGPVGPVSRRGPAERDRRQREPRGRRRRRQRVRRAPPGRNPTDGKRGGGDYGHGGH